ncbi:(R)-mandelonitrile lyase [Paenibacillus arenilitoris]|uniref:Carboxymuconolactone decarboxylase family protein n=1 Tax=Paenibacillus arenilitoris TaxID=2772299 RepID=A0A927CV56_9BACL|nr:carboxymuconolactone decarboxylase family protein [Paenibacillus arenilitoris]MBD2872781.1 carboxymuconolactone decarboxylase family protein [Paenibacillus arenilitoris]
MKKIVTMILSISLLVSATLYAGHVLAAEESNPSQTITRSGSQATVKGSAEYFTGNVRIDPLFPVNDPANYTGAYVTFEPGARSAWHTHPAGQRLIVTEGVGLLQEWGGPAQEIRAGDVIWCPPGVKHWHGASPATEMTHIALTGVLDGQNVEWLEKVSDEQYDLNQPLTARQENIVTIAAFTAAGDLPKLEHALNEGLDAGLTVNEIKEILVQMYAYAGFPRALNGINTFMAVMEEREEKGIKDETGKEASPLPADKSSVELGTEIQTELIGAPAAGGYITFAPAIDEFLKGHLFGDIFGRDNLDFQSRELATIAALANMSGVNSQLESHFKIGFNTGLTEAQMKRLISVLEVEVGKKEADNAHKVLDKVLSNKAD